MSYLFFFFFFSHVLQCTYSKKTHAECNFHYFTLSLHKALACLQVFILASSEPHLTSPVYFWSTVRCGSYLSSRVLFTWLQFCSKEATGHCSLHWSLFRSIIGGLPSSSSRALMHLHWCWVENEMLTLYVCVIFKHLDRKKAVYA